MMPAPSQNAVAPGDFRGAFAERPPSQAWECIADPAFPPNQAWVWFKPPQAPQGLVLRIPEDAYRRHPQLAAQWTVRKLLLAAGVNPAAVSMWSLYGVAYDAMNGAAPYLDAPIPRPVGGVDPNLVVHVATAQVPQIAQPAAAPPPAAVGLDDAAVAEAFERIETDWSWILEIEKELTRLRKQLLDLMGRLKTLNRDLTPQERLVVNNQDKKDWLEARRHLRDGSLRLWKCVKEVDIGDTTAAGQRKWFEQTYEQQVVPRVPFDGLLKAQRDFEHYRKAVQTVQGNANNAYSVASLDGERRAQQVMARIATKLREATNKKSFLGVIIDG